jgi:hypothetical protein
MTPDLIVELLLNQKQLPIGILEVQRPWTIKPLKESIS